MTDRWDETWHRLLEWTNGSAVAERLAAQILLHEGFQNLDPSHPLGGQDGKKDALCRKNGLKWIMAVYFPRRQKDFKEIKKKFMEDLKGVETNKAEAFIFVTNQELRLSERKKLKETNGAIVTELFHLERITAILDKPEMESIRKQFLKIDFADKSKQEILSNMYYYQPSTEIREEISTSITGFKTKKFSYIDPYSQIEIPLGEKLI